MVIIDDVAVRTVGSRAATHELHQVSAAEEQFQSIVIHTHAQLPPDQPGRHVVEGLLQGNLPELGTDTTVSS